MSSSSAPPATDPVSGDTLLVVGPVLVGCMLSYLLLGVVFVQVYIYYMSFPNDKIWIKASVYTLFFLDLAQTVAASSTTYSFLCSGWGRPEHLQFTEWGFAFIPFFCGICSGLVQIFFAWRIYLLGSPYAARKLLWTVISGVIVVIALVQSISAIIETIDWLSINNVQRFPETFKFVAVWLGGSAGCDVIITISMFYLLHDAREKARRHQNFQMQYTDHLFSRLLRNTVETGAVTAGAAIADMILLLVARNTSLHSALSLGLSKLYTNTLYASLNARVRFKRDKEKVGHVSTLSLGGHSSNANDSTSKTKGNQIQDVERVGNANFSIVSGNHNRRRESGNENIIAMVSIERQTFSDLKEEY